MYPEQKRNPKTLENKGFSGKWRLLPLDRRGRFASDIVHDAVDAADFVDDAGGGPVEDVVGDAGPIGRHKIGRRDAAQGQGVVIRAAVTHDANGAHTRQNGKILVDRIGQAGVGDFLPEDEIGVPQHFQGTAAA